jgi:DNA-binding response OmpR family regulator
MPRYAEDSMGETECRKLRPAPGSTEGRVILGGVDSDLRRLVGAAIRTDGYDVVEVTDLSLLIRQVDFSRSLFSLRRGLAVVIADIGSSGLMGLESLSVLRALYCDVPVIFVTASRSERMLARVRSLGPSAMLTTPLDVHVLWDAVREATRSS